jgi:DNA-binding transcriptional regulator YhcF (GntR family)
MTDSPVKKALSTLINQASPVYIQFPQQIINAIQRSYLAGGSYCPELESLANKCPPALAWYMMN